jgi:hypothetical protein
LPKPQTLAESLNFTVLRVVATNHQTGKKKIGTGYVCRVKFDEFKFDEFSGIQFTDVLVTNKHVIKDADVISFDVHLAGSDDVATPDSETLEVTVATNEVPIVKHPRCDLIAIVITPSVETAAAAKGLKFFLIPLFREMFLSDEAALGLDLVEPITMIGYPKGLSQDKRIVRKESGDG